MTQIERRQGRLWPLPLLGVCLALALAGCGGDDGHAEANVESGPEEPPQEAITVDVAPVVRGEMSSLYTTSTTLRAEARATVIARTRGVIERLAVEEGDQVSKGQALAYLENQEQEIAAERARATARTRQSEFERIERLYGQELISDEQFETARRDAEDAANAVALAELELSRTVIRAPFAGVILARHLDVGATVADGTEVYDLADLSPLYADISVPERHVAQLEAGQTVRLSADAAGSDVTARIERIAPAVDPASGTVKVTATVADAGSLRPGAFVRVGIVTATRSQALIVPRGALVAEGRSWNLFRLADDDSVEQLEVKLGFEEGDQVEIAEVVAGGEPLAEGDRVVSVGASALSDGSRIRLADDAS